MEERDGKVYVRLASNLLFASGSTSIDPEGQKALVDLAQAIEERPTLKWSWKGTPMMWPLTRQPHQEQLGTERASRHRSGAGHDLATVHLILNC